MANEVITFNPQQVPAFARNAQSSIAKALAGNGGNNTKRISIEGGVFRLIAGGKEIAAIPDRHLDVVIVAAAPSIGRTFYAGTYVKGQASGPDCWSSDGERPDASIDSPQSDRCATCPNNAKGSGTGDSRACRFSQRLAVVLANDITGSVLQLTAPATSIFGKEEGGNRPLQAYARWLGAQSIAPEALVTRIKFDLKATAPKMFFEAARWLDDDEYTVCQAAGATEAAQQAVTMAFAKTETTAAPAPLALPGKPPKAAKPAAAPEQAEEATEEPTKRKEAAPAAAPKKATNMASIIDNWDADDE
jgi:hypothetical protein